MKKTATLAAVGLLAAALTVPAGPAAADEDCSNPHCYGMVDYNTGNITAVGVDLWTDCLHVDTPSTNSAVHQMWMWTSAPPATWIETGYIRGGVAGGDPEDWFRWYWAEAPGGGTYYSHFIEYASVNQWKNVSFYKNFNNTWGVYLGGSYKGTTAQTATYGVHVQVGAETSTPLVYSHGKSKLLQWRQPSDTWVWGSPSAYGGTAGVYSVTASGTEMEQTSLQRMCSTPLAAKRATAKAPTTADLKKAALAVASQYGEKTPTDVQVVTTTRKAAQRAVGAGDKVDTDQATYLVQMKGTFTGRAPKGATLPHGNTMTVTVDAKTGEVTDTSLGNTRQDLKKLGAVKAL
ncbi:hypothetical protein [Nonomuraea angiospora]|uniref:hypothetical protein n=1 Tax=Nonomuraea angiospora TaxID=46172 RepID=UPI00299FD137|nr:hypothetical protein [Nonomuraea angiospora]MDX3101765.1 hypothetical protein [Nonomuraea angiospora]